MTRKRTSIHFNWRTYYTAEHRLNIREDGRKAIHLVIRKRSGLGNIPWEILQLIKDDCCGEDATAVEIYPPHAQVVNEINARHLWILDDELTRQLPSLAH